MSNKDIREVLNDGVNVIAKLMAAYDEQDGKRKREAAKPYIPFPGFEDIFGKLGKREKGER